jgi:putative spermidine/putrescine transport system permease protein
MSADPRTGRRRRLTAFRWVVLVVSWLFFLTPIAALVEFSTRPERTGEPGRSLDSWKQIGTAPGLLDAIWTSVELAVLTSVVGLLLLVPTMIWIRLRVPRLSRVVEFLCLLPLTVPAIVLVVGLAPIYLWVTYLLGDSPLTLTFAYVVLVLPYTYRALDAGLAAIDLRTLSEAARSLGAGWGSVMTRIVVPNIAGALLNAGLLSVALVLGEYTIASLLNFTTVPVAVVMLGRASAGVSIAVSAASLLISFGLLLALSLVRLRRRTPGSSSALPAAGAAIPVPVTAQEG